MALLAIVVVLYPFSGSTSVVTTSFDQNLLAIGTNSNSPATTVNVSGDSLLITAANDSRTVVTVAGLRNEEQVAFDLEITEPGSEGSSVELMLWNPKLNCSLVYDFDPNLTTLTIVLSNNTITRVANISRFAVGDTFHFSIEHKLGRLLRVTLEDSVGSHYTEVSDQTEFRDLLDGVLYLTLRVGARSGDFSVLVSHFRMELFDVPGYRVSDPVVSFAVGAVVVGTLAVDRGALANLPLFPKRLIRRLKYSKKIETFELVALVIAACIAYSYLSRVGYHIFDGPIFMRLAYIAARYGPASLYSISYPTVLADPIAGTPGGFSGLPYPPLAVYYFALIGWTRNMMFPASTNSLTALEDYVKGLNLVATITLGLIVRQVARQKGASPNVALGLMSITLFNPSIVLDSAVWGQNDAALLVPLLLSLYFFGKDRVGAALTCISLAVLFKQTAIPAALVMIVLALRIYGPGRFLQALSTAVTSSFVALSPLFLLGLDPHVVVTTLVDPVLTQFLPAQPLGGPPVASISAYNFYVLLSAFGASGYARFWSPVNLPIFGSILTLQEISRIIVLLVCASVLIFVIAAPKRNLRKLLTLGSATLIIGLVYFFAGATGRYFLLALPFLILSFPDMKRSQYLLSISILSVSSGCSVLQELISGGAYRPTILPFFDPAQNPVMGLLWQLLTSDWFISLISLLGAVLFVILLKAVASNSLTRRCESTL